MRLSILTSRRRAAGALPRLQAMGLRAQVDSLARLEALDSETLDWVYLLPAEELETEAWGETRVLLARASRRYVVFGDGMSTRVVVEAMRDGAHDVIDLHDDDGRWAEALESAARSQALWWQLYGAQGPIDRRKLVGHSAAMQSLRDSIQRIGPTDATVLLMGESGTGKERVAEALHEASGRAPFVTVNCAAIPSELMESELFGAEKGAYTGANRAKPGLVEEASGGTLFLDEIGEMDIALQPKLLRFLETRRARRVGSTKEYACQVRVISATNRDLRVESERGTFRPDLFYRLSEVILQPSPLRHRTEDIPELSRVFLEGAAVRLGKNFETVEPELIHRFQGYDWPGNIRQLKQAIERLAIHYDGPVMRSSWWSPPGPVASASPHAATTESVPAPQALGPLEPGRPLNRREKLAYARQLLDESGGDLTWTAARLGVHPTTLYRWRRDGKV